MRKITCEWKPHDSTTISLDYIENFRTIDEVYRRGLHEHEKVTEVSLIKSGSSKYYIDDNFYEVHAHDLVVINAQKLHSLGDILPSLIIGIHIPSLIDPATVPVFHFDSKVFSIMERITKAAFELMKREDIDSHELANNLIIASLMPFINEKVSAHEHIKKTTPAIVSRAESFINQNFEKSINVQDICKNLSVSHTYLDKKFRENIGTTPIKYLMSRRMGEAQRLLLENPDWSITQVAMHVGINNPNYFQRNFKLFTGVSPQQFRIKIDKKEFEERQF